MDTQKSTIGGKIYAGVGDFKSNQKIEAYIQDVLKTGRLSYGQYISRFEKEFTKLHGSRFGIMTNSGTSALLIALQTLKIHHNWQDGDEVIIPATTFIATANIVYHNRMTPVLVDVEKDFYGINPKLIEEKITSRTRCIIPVHLFGQACQMDEIMDIASKHELKVIEDSCEAMFVDFDGQPVGSFADISCFSTYIAHILITGVGGIAITSNPHYAITLRSLINHGRDSIYLSIDDDKGKTEEQLKEIIEKRFLFIHPGHSFRITEFEGALGLAQLEEWGTNIKTRQGNARYLTEHLSELSNHLQLPKIRPKTSHAFMMYPIIQKTDHKQKLCNHLENLGIETRDMLPLINQPFYKKHYGIREKDFPVSDFILKHGFYIGCHPYQTPVILDHIIQSFHSFFRGKIVEKPVSSVLVLITSKNSSLSCEIFSKINTTIFDNILIFDFYPENSGGETLREMGYNVINVPERSMLSVYNIVLERISDENIIFFHLDGSLGIEVISPILSYLKLGYDLVIASRFLPGGKRYDADSLLPLRGIGNRLITLILNFVFDANVVDSYQPCRGTKLEFLCQASLDSKSLVNYQMTIRAVTRKRKLYEIPAVENKSENRIGLLRAIWLALLTIPLVIREKLFHKPKE